MASYGGGGPGGQGPPQGPASGPGGDNSINNLMAQLRRTQQSQRADSSDHTDSSAQYRPQLMQLQFASSMPPFLQEAAQHQYIQQQQQQQQHYQQLNQPHYSLPGGNNINNSYLPPAAPTPPSGNMSLSGAVGGGSEDRTVNLLNLLKISSGQGAQQTSSQPVLPQTQSSDQLSRESLIRHASHEGVQTIHAPAPSSADPTGLLAALMKGKFQNEAPEPEVRQQQSQQQPAQQAQQAQQPAQQQPSVPANTWNAGAPSDGTQQYLLNLLNRPKPSQGDMATEATVPTERNTTDVPAVPTTSSFEPQVELQPSSTVSAPTQSSRDGTPANKASMFTYKNPFEDLAAASSSPQNRASKSSATRSPSIHGQAPAPIQILKKPDEHKRLSSTSSHLESREHIRRKVDSSTSSSSQDRRPSNSAPYPDQSKESVSEAVNDIAHTVDQQAQQAIARSEEEQAQAKIAQDLQNMMAATTDKEFETAAAMAASDIKHEIDRKEDQLSPEVVKAVRDIVDDAAQGQVADSWESAEADDEIVVIEETTKPITVYNFPMRPWISITVFGVDGDARPVFRDESILDIARLKKEFDQVDRNLVAASENYLAYGMSKAGGLRVIRQDDGRDAKLFSDTKDRIFNLAISSTPADQHTSAKECIIGTGISGTVYWTQLKDGDKDHIEDAHLEQYGFALPPNLALEGDAAGGALKTRARSSASHPEFFAVGRGKAINMVFPYYITQRNLLKPGHDRVVDIDRLAKELSLKIHTGKAGKDFSFSHDDTMVVSLDKSGRVKFWDVSELTATDERGLPLVTSMEVKEPLLTLATAPDQGKAWPTSVLLLDKLRPYQKRTALRYMIVGMRQNHTLQLWDLALSKPVQEFNLPHDKESDAVCSVMYHPPTGIIAVGHPTRNSIYFLHLSAPKYSLKTSSQVDYVRKLVAQDPSISVPDSTAVISGMREYSFANKGTLRSLYLLRQPASSAEGDQATLFELYVMHSKGVACLSIKAEDLGWDKDNKVVEAMDAEKAGIVKLSKLQPMTAPSAAPPSPPGPRPGFIDRDIPNIYIPTMYRNHPSDPPNPAMAPSPIRLAVRPKSSSGEASIEVSSSQQPQGEARASSRQKDPKEELSAPAVTSDQSQKRQRKKRTTEKPTASADREREPKQASQVNGSAPRVVATTSHKPADSSASSSFTQEVDTRIHSMEKRLSQNIVSSLQSELNVLRKSMDRDVQARDAKFDKSQGALIRTVADTLSENVQDVLTKIVQDELQGSITPVVGRAATDAVTMAMDANVRNAFDSAHREIEKILFSSVDHALSKPELAQSLTDKLVRTLSNKIDEQLYSLLEDKIIPTFTKLATEASSACGKEILANVTTQFAALEQLRDQDMKKFEQLVALNTSMSETLNTMLSAQTRFQEEILRLQGHLAQQRGPSSQAGADLQGRGNGAVYNHSPSYSQSKGMPNLAAAVIAPQPSHQSPHASLSGSHFATNPPSASLSSAALTSPPQQQVPWAGSTSNIMSPPQAQFAGQNLPFQNFNPNIMALQRAEQYTSPSLSSTQLPSQRPQQDTHEQVVFQPTSKENRQRLEYQELCDRVRKNMNAGNYDEAVMAWVSLAQQKDEDMIFTEVLANYDPVFIRSMNPLLLLTVAATVTTRLASSPLQHVKLSWIEQVLYQFYECLPRIVSPSRSLSIPLIFRSLANIPFLQEGQVREVTPKVMGMIRDRLEEVLRRQTASTQPVSNALMQSVTNMITITYNIAKAMGFAMESKNKLAY